MAPTGRRPNSIPPFHPSSIFHRPFVIRPSSFVCHSLNHPNFSSSQLLFKASHLPTIPPSIFKASLRRNLGFTLFRFEPWALSHFPFTCNRPRLQLRRLTYIRNFILIYCNYDKYYKLRRVFTLCLRQSRQSLDLGANFHCKKNLNHANSGWSLAPIVGGAIPRVQLLRKYSYLCLWSSDIHRILDSCILNAHVALPIKFWILIHKENISALIPLFADCKNRAIS